MKKSDVIIRGDHPAINIKVPYRTLERSCQILRDEQEIPEDLTEEWIRSNLSEDELSQWWQFACESEYEYFTQDVEDNIWPGLGFYVDGRSGGWAVAGNISLDAFDGWDAIDLARWAKVVKIAREIAAGVNEQCVMLIYLNVWERVEEEERAAEKRRKQRGRPLRRVTFA